MRTLLWLLLASICGTAGFVLGHGRRQPAARELVLGHVNGQALTQSELDGQLSNFRSQAMERLVQLKLLEREAARQGLKVPAGGNRTQALVRALILKEAGPQELAAVYQSCGPELALYDCSVMLFGDEESESAALDKLAQGGNFEQLAHSYSQDERTRASGGRVGWVSMPELKARYGPYVAEAAALARLNQVSPPVVSPYGSMVVLVRARKSRFEELREACEKVLVEARTTALLARLTKEAVIGP